MEADGPKDDWILDPDLGSLLPPKPQQPPAGACCGSGCLDCVMIVYQRNLRGWRKQVRQIKKENGP